MGFLLATYDPLWMRTNWIIWGILTLLLMAPILLRWHHLILVFCWNMIITLFFLPGSPAPWIPMTCLSLGISILQRTLNNRMHFISAPMTAWPLIFMGGVVYLTAKLTGGIGLHSLGNDTAGGKKYVLLFLSILGYFALTARPIPPKNSKVYIALFFLPPLLSFISDLGAYASGPFKYLFLFIPMNNYNIDSGQMGFMPRFAGLGWTGTWGFMGMLAYYGIRGIFLGGKPWRFVLFVLFTLLIPLGGFRSTLILCSIIFAIQFFLEGAQRTRVMPVFFFTGLVASALLVPFANKLPYTFQRTLAFLPVNISQEARRDAGASEDWRIQVWKEAYPMVPQYLLLGRGYALSQEDLEMAGNSSLREISAAKGNIGVVGNWHSGPLSVLIPFGAWGAIALIWFWIASLRTLYLNQRNGDPSLSAINKFFFAYYIAKILLFLIVFGDIVGDMIGFAGIIGLNIALNNGVRRPATDTVTAPVKAAPRQFHPQLQPSFRQ